MAKNNAKKRTSRGGPIAVPPRIYNANGKVKEGKFKDYLQDNPNILEKLLNYKRTKILWFGREFGPHGNKRDDFAGVDSEGYFITVEVKVNQVSSMVVDQVREITQKYLKVKKEGDITRRVKNYILSKVRNAKWGYFMGPVNEWWGRKKIPFKKHGKVGLRTISFNLEREYKKVFGKSLKLKGVKIFIIAPSITPKIIEHLRALEKRSVTTPIKYIIMNKGPESLTLFCYHRF